MAIKDITTNASPAYTGTVTAEIADDKLIELFKLDAAHDESAFQDLSRIISVNEDYWAGRQIDPTTLYDGESSIVVNRILVGIESIGSIVSSQTPEPWVIVEPKNKRGRSLEGKLRRLLRDEWEFEQNMQQIFEVVLRLYHLSRFGMLGYGLDEDGRRFTEELRAENIRFDVKARTIDESPYFIKKYKAPIGQLKKLYPDKKEELDKRSETLGGDRAELRCIEYWLDFYDKKGSKHTLCSWIALDPELVLKKEVDPLFNKGKNNHFKFPRKPFIPFSFLKLGKSVIEETSRTENAIPLQDSINRRKRQIDRNAWMANGIMVGSALSMEQKDFDAIGYRTKKVFLNKDAENVGSGFAVVTGRPFERGIYDDMEDSKRELDNVYGIHATTRGEPAGGGSTLGGQVMQKDADYGQQDSIFRVYEQVAEEWFNAQIQLMMVADSKEYGILSNRDSSVEPLEDYKIDQGLAPLDSYSDVVTKKELKEFRIRVIVKRGTTTPDDPATKTADAMKLMQTGMIDPITFAEMYGFDDPKKIGRRVYLYKSNPGRLFPEVDTSMMLVHPVALQHLAALNSTDPKERARARTDVYSQFTDKDDLSAHVETHRLYMQGAEVDSDLTPYNDLPVDDKMLHQHHLKFEFDQLILLQQKEALTKQGQSIPPAVPADVTGGEPIMPAAETTSAPTMPMT